jgi:gliding motility-associated-like protein
MPSGTLDWYLAGVALPPTPTPSTLLPGTTTWYVAQTVNGCESDSTAITVAIVPLPVFNLQASSPWVCQYDSITISYTGPAYPNPAYMWTLPAGDSLANGSKLYQPSIMVAFDSSSDSTYMILNTSDDYGKCFTNDTIRITVIPHPTAYSFTKQDVCVGDTVSLAIATKSTDAETFNWYVDYITPMATSGELVIVASNSNTGGPFSISWLDTGTHVIQLNAFTDQGCTSKPTFDTVNVHAVPDASFKITNIANSLCIEDSVLFTANTINYNLSYAWAPAHSFTNINEPSAWGRVEQAQSIMTLTVTDPFGCAASSSLELDPGTCCTVAFPNAFTPNGDGQNDFFHPLFQGYHRFHEFRVQNRWGQTVFESANSGMRWDGNYNGVPQDIGTYYYYISYDCGGKTIEETGDVTLLR